jgi:hypothetical protein
VPFCDAVANFDPSELNFNAARGPSCAAMVQTADSAKKIGRLVQKTVSSGRPDFEICIKIEFKLGRQNVEFSKISGL